MIPMQVKMARTIVNHFQGLIAYYDFSIPTGPLESTNNKIKIMN
jgi:transposase